MPRILIVDDDELDREAAARCLGQIDGLVVDEAADGREALERMSRCVPDVVLADLRMPGLGGLELVERMQESHPLVPVVLMTSKGNEQVAVSALRAGAASYVPKADLERELAPTVYPLLDRVRGRRARDRVLVHVEGCETRFTIDNDPALVAPLAVFIQENLERLGFAEDGVRTQVGMAVMEALTNAIVHGNLEVASELRDDSLERYHEVIRERRERLPFAARRVRCVASESPARVRYEISDEGPGFDPDTLPDPCSPENLVRVRGRGILLMRTFMDEVRFNERGNSVVLAKSAAAHGERLRQPSAE